MVHPFAGSVKWKSFARCQLAGTARFPVFLAKRCALARAKRSEFLSLEGRDPFAFDQAVPDDE